jgi:mannose-1-phosphate guanylyltransferase/mannose-6-phosphate isomerase
MADTIIVATADAVLVVPCDRGQEVKRIVERLIAEKRPEGSAHRLVHRPWGSFHVTDMDDGFQVKRLVVNPGAKLSLQKHHHRAEHWIVVRGMALVTRGEETFVLSENESIHIPLGVVHRLENPGKSPLHLVEVQCGAYLGEDDIVRFSDSYGRQ